MQESLLHYIWQFQYFDRHDLKTTSGEEVVVFNPGMKNTNAGPDFSNARIRIGNIDWIGHVEIHIHASGWNDHKHHLDKAYENVVLHVVWKEDAAVKHNDNSSIPTLELQGRVDHHLLLRYNTLLNNPEQIPCAQSIEKVRDITRISMLEKALTSRLENKAGNIHSILDKNNNDWEETCYQLLCRNFGFKVNSDPMFELSKSVPYRMLMKHADKPIQVEAMLFGQAGLLEEPFDDEYLQILKREYSLLAQKFGLHHRRMNKAQWRFLRMRPANFPTIRLAQLASLLHQRKNIFSKFIEAQTALELKQMLTVKQSEYWRFHYMFSKSVDEEIPGIGDSSIANIIINTVVPLLVAYGKSKDDQEKVDRAVRMLHDIESEDNNILKKWSALGVESKNAFDSQALIELHNNYCLRRKCLDCAIGSSLIRPASV
jgi:hypothetical protein